MWLKLSDSIYWFGEGGVNKIEAIDSRYKTSMDKDNSLLYVNNIKLGSVVETVDEISQLLYVFNIQEDETGVEGEYT